LHLRHQGLPNTSRHALEPPPLQHVPQPVPGALLSEPPAHLVPDERQLLHVPAKQWPDLRAAPEERPSLAS